MPRPKNNILHDLLDKNGANEIVYNNGSCNWKILSPHTGNLKRHLRQVHPELYSNYVERKNELQALAAKHSNIHILEIDLHNYDAYDSLVKQIDEITQGKGLNVLFNNAAISYGDTKLSSVKPDEMLNTLKTNVVVPLMLTKACLPLLEKASKLNDSLEMSLQRAAIINMSSLLGSIEMNNWGGWYSYGSSKSALNSVTKSLSVDLLPHKILCVAMHPGWVRTDMGGENAPLEVESTTEEIVETIMKFNATHHAGFYQHNGEKLAW